MAGKTSKKSTKVAKKSAAKRAGAKAKPVKLLSGGNPQIAKGDGDAPVQAYIAAMPGWKGDIGRRLDAIIERNVPNVRKAVRWNTPFYGIEGQGWFLGFHCITKYVKVAFFRGTSLRPVPPGESKHKRCVTSKTRFVGFRRHRPNDRDHPDADGSSFTFLGSATFGESRGKATARCSK